MHFVLSIIMCLLDQEYEQHYFTQHFLPGDTYAKQASQVHTAIVEKEPGDRKCGRPHATPKKRRVTTVRQDRHIAPQRLLAIIDVLFYPKLLSTDVKNPVFLPQDHIRPYRPRLEDIASSIFVGLVSASYGLELTGVLCY